MNHPKTKHGKYSKILPKNISATYENGLRDPRLLELREEVALVDARLVELVDLIGSGESSKVWYVLGDYWTQMMEAVRNSDVALQNELFPELNKLIRRGASKAAQWDEVTSLQDHRRKLSESEQKRMQVAQQMIAVEQVMVLMSATIATLRESVLKYADEDTATRILDDASKSYKRLVGTGLDGRERVVDVQPEG